MPSKILLALVLGLGSLCSGCGRESCSSPNDCPFGSYCVLDVDGSQVSGSCTEDCFEHTDCPAPVSAASRAICDNRGRCQIVPRPPKLRLRFPETDAMYPEGTRTIQVSGEVASAAEQVQIEVTAISDANCPGGPPTRIRLENPTGRFSDLPFLLDSVPVEPSTRRVRVRASVGGSSRQREVDIGVSCPGCAVVTLERPLANTAVASLVLTEFQGRVDPAVSVALWRVRGGLGGVFDGAFPVSSGGLFSVDRLPLFAGSNQVEVFVSGVGGGRGQTRCSTYVQAAGRDRGLRLVLTWDIPGSDLDMHLVGAGGQFGDPLSALSARTPNPSFGGEVLDDFDGFGPEVLAVENLPDGVYGLVVEPVVGAGSAVLRPLAGGTPLTTGPVGPRYVDADVGNLWVVGTFTVVSGDISWRPLDDEIPVDVPPLNAPSLWPAYR